MRWLLVALGAVGVCLWVDALLGGGLAGAPLGLVLVACLAGVAGWRSRLPELVLTGLLVAALLAVANQVTSPGQFSLANDGLFYTVVVLAPGLTGWLLGTRNRLLAELRWGTAELERLRAASVAAARATEAERIERQVDLALAKRLGEIVVGVRDADALVATCPGDVPARLAAVQATAREALAELRDVLGVLAPEPPRPSRPSETPIEPARFLPLDRIDLLLLLAALPLAVETSQSSPRGAAWLDAAACLGLGLLLPVVRRRPLVGSAGLFALVSVQAAWLAPVTATVSLILPGLLVPFMVGAGLPRRTAPAGLALVLAGFGAAMLVTPDADRALDGIMPSAVMIVLAWWAGRSLAVREARAAALRLVVDDLRRTRDEQARLAAAEQRAEMARDLHDVGAHALTVVCLQSGAAEKLWNGDPARARVALASVRALADGSLSHLGASLGELAGGDTEQPLGPAALEVVAGLGRVLGLSVDVAVHGTPRDLDARVARVAFRVVQESLTNAARHAPHATVGISLDYTADVLEVRVRDRVHGGTPDRPSEAFNGSGIGLRGMRERVEACQGELSYGPTLAGFTVYARLPMLPLPTVVPS